MQCGAHIPCNIQCTNQVLYVVTSAIYHHDEQVLKRYVCVAHLIEAINTDMRLRGVVVTMVTG